ncbi:MAG: tetratricopeptide repeat protein [Saprospiraceae bacterium]
MKSVIQKLLILHLFITILAAQAFSQCQTWIDLPNRDAIEEAHVLYRQFVKSKDYDSAFEYWKKAYEAAPAADGQRSYHYSDGIKIYKDKFKKETDEAKKKEYIDIILRLYDEQVQCYPKEKALALGLKVYDMFYLLNTSYSLTKAACEQACKAGGDNTSYVVFQPYASITVYEFKNNRMDAAEARNIYLMLNEIADYNIEHNKKYSAYYKQGKEAMNGTFAQIENDIFDCEYFKNKFEPQYRANPDSTEMLKYFYNRLVQQGCSEEDPFVNELKGRYEDIIAAENEAKLAAYYAENPGDHGIALFKEGKFSEALAKFEEAIKKEKESGRNKDKLADYHFYMASIEFRQLKRYAAAREDARIAARLRGGWGRPYMLIGDMYASSSNSCGSDAFEKQLAVIAAIDKYTYARSIDSTVAREASKKIAKYTSFLPDKEEAFMRKINEGDTMTVPCWIGESVKVRFKQ